jgi:hypothetical protein
MPQAQYTVSSAIHISGSNWRITKPKWSECFGVLDTMFALFSRSPETRERPDSSRKEPCLPGSRILVVGRRSYASSWLGVIATLVVMPFVGWLYLRLGYDDLRADAGPSWFESTLAVTAMETSAARHATKQDNPIQPAEANLIDGARLYRDKCADCRTFRCRGCGSKGKLRQLTIEIGWGVPADSVQ